jgi:hypothetical protein
VVVVVVMVPHFWGCCCSIWSYFPPLSCLPLVPSSCFCHSRLVCLPRSACSLCCSRWRFPSWSGCCPWFFLGPGSFSSYSLQVILKPVTATVALLSSLFRLGAMLSELRLLAKQAGSSKKLDAG